MNSALVLTILVALLPMTSCIICRYRSCEEEPCYEVTPENCPGRIARKASPCGGCCDVCIRYIAPGALCSDSDWTRFFQKECSPGHYCDYENTKICHPISDVNLV